MVDKTIHHPRMPPLTHTPTNDLYTHLLAYISCSSDSTSPDSELLQKNMQTVFLVADVTSPLLHDVFLSHFPVLVDVANRRLVNADSYSLTPLQPSPFDLTLHIIVPMDPYAHLLTSYSEVFRSELRQTPMIPTNHGIYHHIKTTGPPVFPIFMCLASYHLEAAKQTFAEMAEMDPCQKASSPWRSPLHIVLKKDGSLCPYGH
ncbi:uncharacterized protein [Palaemon carinicauda]|uniref:uncharacterized protein n=1 Tax=Palaemon carinicauda TaxID=392227 RepID=UPI0035B5B50B